MSKYLGSFDDFNSVVDNFSVTDHGLTDENIILARYDTPPYEGYATVVFVKDGKLYEVHGSHCSCYGLEDQWSPEETYKASLMTQSWTEEEKALLAAIPENIGNVEGEKCSS
jgi:hypothetical protein